MRNLELVDSVRVCGGQDLQHCAAISVDYDTKVVYCATNTSICIVNPQTDEVSLGVSLTQDGYLPEDGSGRIVGIQHLADQMAVCIATQAGDVLLWTLGGQELECVGSVESGIQCMAWSPDMEILVLITGDDKIVLMSRDFDPITEAAMHPGGVGEAQFVTVGWGKKETQFHGSEGKAAATKQKEQTVQSVSSFDDRRPRVSWRGDGQYFVVSSVRRDQSARVLRVWTRECTYHSSSENTPFSIQQSVAWKPTGMLIASSQQTDTSHDIIFFERNGLRHGEFSLPFEKDRVNVRELSWNSESSVLCVWCEELAEEGSIGGSRRSWLQLWTTSNYHWYLKQTLEFTPEHTVKDVIWDPEQEYTLHVICGEGLYAQYRWAWSTNCAPSNQPSNESCVAVIDGDRVLMTPFKSMVVPPPMCAYALQLPCAVNHVMFTPDDDVIVVLSDGRLAIYTYADAQDKADSGVTLEACGGTGFATKCKLPVLKDIITLEGLEESGTLPLARYHYMCMDSCLLFCTSTGQQLHVCDVMRGDRLSVQLRKSVDVFERVFSLAGSHDTGSVALQTTDGAVYKVDLEECSVSPWCDSGGEHVVFAQPCSQMALCTLAGQEVVIGLTDRFRLYVNKLQLSTSCTSMAVHEQFLLLTSHAAHTLRCVPRSTRLAALAGLAEGKLHAFDESVRRVERGSRLVRAVCGDTRVVLQMPRGNLETIHPRALVLAAVRGCLDRLEFGEAFVLMRRHRINMNLLHDHEPCAFLQHVQRFVTQINHVQHLNLFLTDLVAEDVTRTMYTVAYDRDVTANENEAGKKVDVICDAVKNALYALDKDKYLLSILTAHVRKSSPELDIALNIVKDLKESGPGGSTAAEEALKYLLFLVDVNELYDVALGTYDFKLVLMVAEKSQKDPKEYLPFLNNLRKLEPDYQKYCIDKHLKRFHNALGHIAKCGEEHFQECLDLVKDQRLYAHAMKIFPRKSQQYKQVACAYGDYLSEKKHDEEAGLVYSLAGEHERTLAMYTRAVNWQQCLCTASVLGYSVEQTSHLARTLASSLQAKRQFVEAATVLEQYANDSEEAIVTLIEGHKWDDALRMMHKHKRLDFIETNLKTCLEETFEQQRDSLADQCALFDRYSTRLDIVRDEKEKRRREILEHGEGPRGGEADLFSDTSSATGDSMISDTSDARSKTSRKSGSVFTRVSGRSGKSRRKEKKKWSLKEGSTNEDCALIEALANVIKQINGVADELGPLLRALVFCHYEDEACALQSGYQALLDHVHPRIAHIWDAELNQFASNIMSGAFGPDSTANTIALAMQQGRASALDDVTADPVLRTPPVLTKDTSWKLNMLETREKKGS